MPNNGRLNCQKHDGLNSPNLHWAHLDTAPTPSPRLSGERAGVRGFEFGNNGLLTPAPSSFGEEREKNGGSARMCPLRFAHAFCVAPRPTVC
jgi:hypothetical protein